MGNNAKKGAAGISGGRSGLTGDEPEVCIGRAVYWGLLVDR